MLKNLTKNDSGEIVEFENTTWPTKTMKFQIKDGVVKTVGFGEPFRSDEGPQEGYNCELMMESKIIKDENMVYILREVTDRIIEKQNIPAFVRKYKYYPMELEQLNVIFPSGYRVPDGHMGVMMSLDKTTPTVQNSAKKDIYLIRVKLMKKRDLLRLRALGPKMIPTLVREYHNNKEYMITV